MAIMIKRLAWSSGPFGGVCKRQCKAEHNRGFGAGALWHSDMFVETQLKGEVALT